MANLTEHKAKYDFNPDADETSVKRHHQGLLAALHYYKKRNCTKKVVEVEDEIEEIKKIYPYIK
jgi:hypothetical protein